MDINDLPPGVCKLKTVEAGDVIFLEGQPAENAYVILRGHADVVVRNTAGDLLPLARMNPGELFGEIALLTHAKARTATVMAADRCEVLEINKDVFEARLAKTDPLVRFVLDHVTKRLVKLTDKIVTDNVPRAS